MGIGTSSHIEIDVKYIVRTALVTVSDSVILVHNHPSNSLEPSLQDKEISNISNQLIQLQKEILENDASVLKESLRYIQKFTNYFVTDYKTQEKINRIENAKED